MAAVLAQRMRKFKHLGAAYFCRHNDGTRNDPRYLLGTVACQLCESYSQYNTFVGGEGVVRNFLGNSKLGVQELFTKLLQEPLGKCNPSQQRKVVIIDALDETEYESRKDFLDLIMHRFPLLPNWLVFFITSRPEDSVQYRLKKYNPCVKICAGNSDQYSFYQQHEQDIQIFLKKRIDCSRLSCTVEDVSRKCHGLFLYAHYIVEELRLFVDSGKESNKLGDLFPGDIDDFFLQNFRRVYDQVGQDLFNKLFGCAIVAPSPLPVSIISYILKSEKVNHDKQQVIDAVSQFVLLRTSDQTLNFLHNLIPAWLTDENKARKLFIDKEIAGEFLREIFVEILSSIVNRPQPKCPVIEDKLKDYVSRVAVRFLCQNSETGSLDAVFSCLTNYHFIERRILSGRIDIYHLLDDLKLAVCQLPSQEVKKREILEEIVNALESNVLVLLECPHLLHTCLRNASKAVQEAVLIPHVSAPRLEWNVYIAAFPDTNIADMQCFATSPNKKTVAGAKGRSIVFFDASSAEAANGPFQVSSDFIYCIDHMEFSPDGKFLFFGRLDKWFSVERGCVEDFPQFSGNCHIYKWGVFTRDGQSIVVKRNPLCNPSTCQAKSCLFNLLALWALKEIRESRDDELTVTFFSQKSCLVPGVPIKRLFERLGMGTNVVHTHETHLPCDPPYDPSCHYCCRLKELTEPNQEPSLETVRQLVIELYSFIFNYQVWDLQTGKPVLQEAFSQGVQLNTFIYFCHVACAYSECGLIMGCSGVEKAMSICNIAAVTVVCCTLLCGFYFGYELELLQQKKRLPLALQLGWNVWLDLELTGEFEQALNRYQMLIQKWGPELNWMREWTEKRWKLGTVKGEAVVKQNLEPELDSMLECTRGLWNFGSVKGETAVKQNLERLVSTGLFKEFHKEAIQCGFYAKIPKSLKDLVYHNVNEQTHICVSPETKWIIEVGDALKLRFLQTGRLEHTISKFKRFSFTNDDNYLVYSCGGSLYALSLQTGAILTSVSGCKLYYFTRERQVGYLFRDNTDERAIFLTNLFSPFKFLSVLPMIKSVVGHSIVAMFRSSDTVISLNSDSMVKLWKTTTNKEAVAIIGESLLKASDPQELNVKNCLLSSDGKLIAVHQGAKIELYTFAEPKGKTFPFNVFESKDEFTVTCFAFSADSALLLFCIKDSKLYPRFCVWDVQNNIVSVPSKPRGLLNVECCCLSSSKRELILCGEYEIEIWQYAEHPHFLTRHVVEKISNNDQFSQCTVSLDNHLLVCCIANTVIVYNLQASDIDSSKRVLHGHVGAIEFCRFLKVNRYLISYGVDGMVFLWDLAESKAVGFARITQDQESIDSMTVSPEEDRAVCFTSYGRVYMIKLCELGSSSALPSKSKSTSLTGQVSGGRVETAETSLPPEEQNTFTYQIPTTSSEVDMAESDSEEDIHDYYREHDDLDNSD